MTTVFPHIQIHFLHPSRMQWITFNIPTNTEVYTFLQYLIWQQIIPNWQYGYYLKYKGQYITQEITFLSLRVSYNEIFEIEAVAPPLPVATQHQRQQPIRPNFGGKGNETVFKELLEQLKKLNAKYTDNKNQS